MVKIFVAENNARWQNDAFKSVVEELPLSIYAKAINFLKWQDAQAFLLGKLLLKKGLKVFDLREDLLHDLGYEAFNRPYFRGEKIDFNITHSGQFVLCAISSSCRVGVDIEKIHEVKIQDFANCFTDDELKKIDHSTDSLSEFFRVWTKKEAVIKADGRGLQIPLREVSVGEQVRLEDTLWYLHTLEIAQGYVAHLAVNKIISDGLETCWISIP